MALPLSAPICSGSEKGICPHRGRSGACQSSSMVMMLLSLPLQNAALCFRFVGVGRVRVSFIILETHRKDELNVFERRRAKGCVLWARARREAGLFQVSSNNQNELLVSLATLQLLPSKKGWEDHYNCTCSCIKLNSWDQRSSPKLPTARRLASPWRQLPWPETELC